MATLYSHHTAQYIDATTTSGTSTVWTGTARGKNPKTIDRTLKPLMVGPGLTLLEQLQNDFRRVTGVTRLNGKNIYPYMKDLPRKI